MRTLRILAASDIHDEWFEILPMNDLPEADVCILAGDLTNMGVFNRNEINRARFAMATLEMAFNLVLWIPGNHDFGLDSSVFRDMLKVHCLLETTESFDPKIRGVSLSVAYNMPSLAYTWCHMTTDPEVERRAFDLEACDILVSHSPPFGVCDKDGIDLHTRQPCHIGSPALNAWIERVQPKLVICGHSHGGSGEGKIGETRIVNVARRFEILEVEI